MLPRGGRWLPVSSSQNFLPPGPAGSSNPKTGQEGKSGEARGSRTCPGERLLGGIMGAVPGSWGGCLPGCFLLTSPGIAVCGPPSAARWGLRASVGVSALKENMEQSVTAQAPGMYRQASRGEVQEGCLEEVPRLGHAGGARFAWRPFMSDREQQSLPRPGGKTRPFPRRPGLLGRASLSEGSCAPRRVRYPSSTGVWKDHPTHVRLNVRLCERGFWVQTGHAFCSCTRLASHLPSLHLCFLVCVKRGVRRWWQEGLRCCVSLTGTETGSAGRLPQRGGCERGKAGRQAPTCGAELETPSQSRATPRRSLGWGSVGRDLRAGGGPAPGGLEVVEFLGRREPLRGGQASTGQGLWVGADSLGERVSRTG